ncbi:hypothetical protein BJ741DRAFT_688627 [Chytriomyces cf. hyalinus JEL632]|nr:hypothetical protein BJ741DRAFT_688627 [Chytriomyces cf. hyalinus JEL632]
MTILSPSSLILVPTPVFIRSNLLFLQDKSLIPQACKINDTHSFTTVPELVYDLILGKDWLDAHNPSIDWLTTHVCIGPHSWKCRFPCSTPEILTANQFLNLLETLQPDDFLGAIIPEEQEVSTATTSAEIDKKMKLSTSPSLLTISMEGKNDMITEPHVDVAPYAQWGSVFDYEDNSECMALRRTVFDGTSTDNNFEGTGSRDADAETVDEAEFNLTHSATMYTKLQGLQTLIASVVTDEEQKRFWDLAPEFLVPRRDMEVAFSDFAQQWNQLPNSPADNRTSVKNLRCKTAAQLKAFHKSVLAGINMRSTMEPVQDENTQLRPWPHSAQTAIHPRVLLSNPATSSLTHLNMNPATLNIETNFGGFDYQNFKCNDFKSDHFESGDFDKQKFELCGCNFTK